MDSYTIEKKELQRQIDALLIKPSLNSSERSKCDLLISKMANLRSDEERIAKFNSVAESVGLKKIVRPSDEQKEHQQQNYDLRSYLSYGREARTYSGMSVAVDANGGYFVPQSFYNKVTTALKLADGLWDDSVITMYEDTHGNALTCPLLDDVAVAAVQISENATSAEAELNVVDKLTLGKIPTWRSKKLVASMELIQDSAFPLEDVIASAIGGRFQRGCGAANVATLLTSITSGATSEAAGAVSINDCLSLMGSLDPAFLNQPKTFFAMNFQTMINLLKIKDSSGRNVWHPRYDANGRALLYGIPVCIMPSLPNATTGNHAVVLGDFSFALRRLVRDSLKVQRYHQVPTLAENGLVAYEGFLRTSFGVLASSSSTSVPIKYLTIA
jgi:HK97 family phage major capsid protein